MTLGKKNCLSLLGIEKGQSKQAPESRFRSFISPKRMHPYSDLAGGMLACLLASTDEKYRENETISSRVCTVAIALSFYSLSRARKHIHTTLHTYLRIRHTYSGPVRT